VTTAIERDAMNFRVARAVKRRVENYARKHGLSMGAAAGLLLVKGLDAERFEADPVPAASGE
jgi:hypothetical protein